MSSEPATSLDVRRKKLQMKLEVLAMVRPLHAERFVVEVVERFLDLPARSLGWDPNLGEMPLYKREQAAITHVELGLAPGMDYIVFIEGQMYIKASALRLVAASDPNWLVEKTEYKAVPMEMRIGYGMLDNDLGIMRIDTVRTPGGVITATGIGTVSEQERRKGDSKYYKPSGSIVATLNTKAERDMLKRFYPIGLLIDEEYNGEPGEKEEPKKTSEPAKTEEEKPKEPREIEQILLNSLREQLAAGHSQPTIEKVVGLKLDFDSLGSYDDSMIADIIDALNELGPAKDAATGVSNE